VQHNHAAITVPAPSTVEIEISLPTVIGETVAMAAIVIAAGLEERRNGGLRPETRHRAGDLVAALYQLHQRCAGAFDFDSAAREFGKRALQARYVQAKGKLNGSCPPFTEEMAAEMVGWPLDALYKVIAAEAN
jgi:hypothetical protein